MSVSEIIKKRREELDLTLFDIATKIGVSEATVQRYESGKIRNIRQDKIVKLAAALKITPAELLGWDEVGQADAEEKKAESKKVYHVVKAPTSRPSTNATDTRLTSADDIVALLVKLTELHDQKVLTDDEYFDKKRDLLSRL